MLGIQEPRAISKAAFRIGRAIRLRGLPRRTSLKGIFTRTWKALQAPIAVFFGQMQSRVTRRMSK